MTKVSVILPVYNSEKYIARCLDSLINQTFRNIEIICVDDCTPDNSMKVISEYAKKDSRIKYIRNEKNLRQGKTRENGFFVSTGDYVLFVDPDDTLDLDYIEKNYNKAIETNAEVVRTEIKIHLKNGYIFTDKINQDMKNYLKRGKSLLLAGQSSPVTFFIKRDFILKHKIIPDPLDGNCCIGGRIKYFVKNIAFVDDSFYNYYYGNDTSFSGQNTEYSYSFRFTGIKLLVDLINSFDIDKNTYIAYMQNHCKFIKNNLKHVFEYYDKFHTEKYIREIFEMFKMLKLSDYEKEKYLYKLINKEISSSIKTENTSKIINYLEKEKKINNIKTKIKSRINRIFRCNSIKKLLHRDKNL